MTAEEFDDFIEASRVSLGEVNRLCCGPEAPVRMQRWLEILGSVDHGDAMRCLDQIELGKLEPPKFDEWTRWATFVRRWAKNNPELKMDYVTIHYADEPRYRCHLCRDGGVVCCINSKWLDAHRSVIDGGTRPSELRRHAFGWCRANNVGPLLYGIACSCGTGERRSNLASRGRFDSACHVRDDGTSTALA
jgi:hypothetical protein